MNAARASRLGVPDAKILDLPKYDSSPLYTLAERAALAWADAMTVTYQDPSDELFARLQQFYTQNEIVELCAVIAMENFRSKFNHALRIPSQHFWVTGP